MNYSIKKITQILSGQLVGNENAVIKDIIIDSRTFYFSENLLFFAISGKRYNGHQYINELRTKGIKSFVIDKNHEISNLKNDESFIIVKNTLSSLQTFAKHHINNYNNHIVAIVGSNGKTIVKEWLFKLLHEEYSIIKSPKSYNSKIGVPLSLLLVNNKYNTAIIEAGISHPGEMEILEKMINPETVILTNIGNAHQENFQSIEQKIHEKLIIAQNAKTLIYCKDNAVLHNIILTKKNLKTFTWSKFEDADLKVTNIKKHKNHSEISAQTQGYDFIFLLNYTDEASINNALSCLSYIILYGNIKTFNLKRFEKLEQVEMRLEQKKGANNCLLINDTYNSDINSLKIALDLLSGQNKFNKKTVILSDILQSGISDEILCQNINKFLINAKINRFIGIGKVLSKGKKHFKEIENSMFYQTTEEFLKKINSNKFKNEAVLIKGARNFKFEQISKILQEKKYRTVLEINMNALVNNLNYYKSLLPGNTKVMIMVKAFSYGNGGLEIANMLQFQNIDYLGVAIVDEGVELRKNGINTKIIVMNPEPDSFTHMIKYNLEPAIFDLKTLIIYAETALKNTSKKVPLHVKMDTGMKRIGFCDYEIYDLIFEIKKHENIYVKSVFSHLAGADEVIFDNFTTNQIEAFRSISEEFKANFDYKIDYHILNSSGIERFPEAAFDMVRLGIGLYGFSSNNQNKLQNVSTLKSKISQIKKVKKGETIGYSRSYKMPDDGKIAIIPIGYADGLSRQLSNGKISFLINDMQAPVVGRICMDLCMVDITNIPAKVNDEVIIFGDKFTADDVAKLLNTISYEIITGISERVKRVYYQE